MPGNEDLLDKKALAEEFTVDSNLSLRARRVVLQARGALLREQLHQHTQLEILAELSAGALICAGVTMLLKNEN